MEYFHLDWGISRDSYWLLFLKISQETLSERRNIQISSSTLVLGYRANLLRAWVLGRKTDRFEFRVRFGNSVNIASEIIPIHDFVYSLEITRHQYRALIYIFIILNVLVVCSLCFQAIDIWVKIIEISKFDLLKEWQLQ